MKKYIPIDFDEKGKVVLGNAKNTPTPMRGTPAIYVESGSDEGKNGLKSISISPAITTNPALDSLFPIYWDDLTDEEKQDGVLLSVNYNREQVGVMGTDVSIAVVPTSEWYAVYTNEEEETIISGKGEALTIPVHLMYNSLTELQMFFSDGNTPGTSTESFSVNVTFHPAA